MFVMKKYVILAFMFMLIFILTSCSPGTSARYQPPQQHESVPYEGKKSENIPKYNTEALNAITSDAEVVAARKKAEEERNMSAEERINAAEERARDMERKADETEQKADEMEQKADEMEQKAAATE